MMEEKKKQVLVAASVASMIDQFNIPNIRLLQQLGYEVHVACNFRRGNTCDNRRLGKVRQQLQDMRIVLHQWDCPRNVSAAAECICAYYQMLTLLDDCHFDWMHCHSPIGGALARIAAHQRGIRVIYTAHGFHFCKGAPVKNWLLYYPVEKFLANWTDVLITVNQEDYRFAKGKLRAGSIYRIPGIGVDVEKYKENTAGSEQAEKVYRKDTLCKKYGIPSEAQILLSVGELSKHKNHRLVIEAMSALSRKDVYYLICGQGTLRRELQSFADKCGVGSRIRMPGYQEELAFIYQGADVFVFPSEREGMPVSLMEAMAAGMACAVSDIRGNRELISSGFRFPLGQPRCLAALLDQLLGDPWLRHEQGSRNRKKVGNYSRAVVCAKMLGIYQTMGYHAEGDKRNAGDIDSDGDIQ